MTGSPVVYEVALEPDAGILAEFDHWLEEHVAEVLALPGFLGASIHRAEEPSTGRAQRVVRYRLRDRAALERYLREDAPRMRELGLARFGDRFGAQRRVIEEGHEASPGHAEFCANCASPLIGQYCAQCGQRARVRMITLWELLQDAGDLLGSLDSRLWRTLGLLVFRPGRLTLDYLQGRRARYVAPFRLFIATSLIFFFVATLNTQLEFGEGSGIVIAPDESRPQAGDEQAGQQTEPQEAAPAGQPTEPAPPAPDESRAGKRAQIGTDDEGIVADENCDISYRNVPDWLPRLLPRERAQQICERIVADHGASFTRALLANLPTMMFVFLPVMALLMKLGYPLSGRYYAEHLLFLVHYHSLFYLLNTLLILAWWAATPLAAFQVIAPLATAAVYVWLPIYLFRAMRRVYGQGFWVTLFKYVLLTLSYFFCLVFTFLGLLAYTALTL